MRIAILSPFHPFRVGLAQFNTRLYKELEKNNDIKAFSFTTLYPAILFPGKTQFVDNDDKTNYIDSERTLNSINPFSYISTAKAINRYSPDTLIIPYWMSFLAPAFGTIVRFLDKNIKVIALVHNAIPHEKHFFDIAFAKYFFSKCDAFIVMSDFVKIDLLKLLPTANILLREHPIFDQYNERIPKEEACLKLDIESGKKDLLFFGLIREYKGLDLLIEAINYLDDSYHLIIAGECYGDFKKYQDLIDRSKFKRNITVFEQYISDDMVTDLFSVADLLVLPYRSATQSGVVAVAYQLEVPMLATNVGALGKTVQDAQAGIVINDVSPKGIADGIKTFFEDSKRDQYLKNIQLEKARLSWASFTQSIVEFSENL